MLGDPRSGPSTLTANSSSIRTTSDLQPGLVDLAAAPRKTVFSHAPNKRPSERGRNFSLLDRQRNGVAFKLAWLQSKKQVSVSGIDIFCRHSDYRPDGCVSPPEQWGEVEIAFPSTDVPLAIWKLDLNC